MNASFTLNNSEVAYLIQGQQFKLTINASDCWFLLVKYDNGASKFKKFYFKKRNCSFESVANVYNPKITVYGFGWGIKTLLQTSLKINFFNTTPQYVRAQTPDLAPQSNLNIIKQNIEIAKQSFAIQQEHTLSIQNKYCVITDYDNWKEYKQQEINNKNQ
jgi:hypothetical protein